MKGAESPPEQEAEIWIASHDQADSLPAAFEIGTAEPDQYLVDGVELTTRLRFPESGAGNTEGVSAASDWGTYGWACFDDAFPPAGDDQGPASYVGSIFLHAERWRRDNGAVYNGGQIDGLPLDIFLPVTYSDCGYAEDAGHPEDTDDGGYYFPDCDGVDNDDDGEVDEYAWDLNEDGVTDCVEAE